MISARIVFVTDRPVGASGHRSGRDGMAPCKQGDANSREHQTTMTIASYLREIGRGAKGARSLGLVQADDLMGSCSTIG